MSNDSALESDPFIKRRFKVGDRVVPKGWTQVIFEIKTVLEGLAMPYELKPLFTGKTGTLRANEEEMRLATSEEIAAAIGRRLISS